ncbi:hypothetical protein ACFYR1_47335 [Streptomyces canus]|uniref:hypothetical protein n=1 Tax=Streptomyces canus TaxID=58343 RepID=UPI0036A91C76
MAAALFSDVNRGHRPAQRPQVPVQGGMEGRGEIPFAGLLGIKFLLCKPRDPEAKGLVEGANGLLTPPLDSISTTRRLTVPSMMGSGPS